MNSLIANWNFTGNTYTPASIIWIQAAERNITCWIMFSAGEKKKLESSPN